VKTKCLFCYNELGESEIDFHKKCSKKIFGTNTAPTLELSLSDIESSALNLLQRSISVTGVQPKLSVDIKRNRNERARFTIVGLWGRYILKPPHSDYPEIPEIEDLTMKLSEISGINTAVHSLIRMKSGELAYLSKRFDRTSKGKLHLEDFAQLLEVLTERKYSGSVEQIGKRILRYSSFPGNDLINFFELVLFCFLTGNADMHLKNYSLLRDEQDYIKLSPAYDLLATKLLVPKDNEEFAITINGKKANIKRADFDKLSLKLGLNEKTKASIYKKYSGIYPKWKSLIEISFVSDITKEKYLSLISDRLKQIDLISIGKTEIKAIEKT
jgi:serine/threonine-protein kinase HipA